MDSQASFVCAPHDTEPADLAAFSSLAPEVRCKNVTAPASATCPANASVDNGSSNRYGESIPLVQTPAGPYGLGVTGVTLTGTDSRDASSSCQATVTVVDQTSPTITGLSATPPRSGRRTTSSFLSRSPRRRPTTATPRHAAASSPSRATSR